MIFDCWECGHEKDETPDNINGRGQYCKNCIDEMFNEDMYINSEYHE